MGLYRVFRNLFQGLERLGLMGFYIAFCRGLFRVSERLCRQIGVFQVFLIIQFI